MVAVTGKLGSTLGDVYLQSGRDRLSAELSSIFACRMQCLSSHFERHLYAPVVFPAACLAEDVRAVSAVFSDRPAGRRGYCRGSVPEQRR